MNVVLDTNVLVSGLFFSGAPLRILKSWHSGQFMLFATKEILEEYERVIRELSKNKATFNPDRAVAFIRKNVRLVKPTPPPHQVCDDPDDDKFLACALTIKAIVVTGDKALLKTMGHQGLSVLTPAAFERQYLI